mmetsp:Transcript_26711/g.76632  ORF Transcript_26711/g.76632 Transcript_26711/m.76632 type:complete len:201 (+) Transcript_26711:76-678(+)
MAAQLQRCVAEVRRTADDYHRRAQRISDIQRRLEAHAGLLGNDNLLSREQQEHLWAQYRICVSVMKDIRREDSLAEQDALIALAEEKLQIVEQFLAKPAVFPPRLMALPDTLIYTMLSPLLGTQTIIGSLSPTHPSLHSLAVNPKGHQTVHFEGSTALAPQTQKQLTTWLPRLSKATRAVFLLPLTEWAVKTVEALCGTL